MRFFFKRMDALLETIWYLWSTMATVIYILFFSIVIAGCFGQGPDESDVEFLSSPSTFNVLENSTIHIPCFLKWMENTTTEWFRNGRKIADSEGSFYATPSNMEAERNYSLRISNIKRIDSGEYSCEVFVLGLRKPLKQSHLVNVFFPPTVYPDPSTGSMEVELPQGFILTCDVIGNPQPRVKWYFQNRLLPMQRDHSVILNVTKSTKGHSGEYQCVADNSIGKPVTATFTIRILFKKDGSDCIILDHPEVVAEKTWIHSAIGERTELACSISANPIAKVDWFHEGIPINMSSTISTRVFGEKHILTIKNMRYSDFGNYTCQGTNFLGRSYQDIHVSGLANTAVFKRDPQIRTETSYTLIWEVDSYSPVIQYSLRFRKQQEGDVEGRWLHLIIPATNVFMSPIQSEMYTLNGLERATVYEASVSAKNVFGWNEYSKIFTFTTLGTESSGNESQNANVTKSIISNISSTITESENFTTDVNSQENALWSTDNASISKLEISVIMSIVISALL